MDFRHDPAGQVTQETLGNGVVTNRAYDAVTGWPGLITSGVGGGAVIQNQSFVFDEMGNVTQRQDGNSGLTENFFYDNDYRLTSSKLNGTVNLSIGYDGMGNVTSRSDVASGATWTYDPTHKHQVTQAGSGSFAYVYDANGNVTSRQSKAISWYTSNYPNSVHAGAGATAEMTSFVYAPDRSRWKQSYTGNSTTETTYYIGGMLDRVTSGSLTDYRHYVYSGEEPIAVYSRTSAGTNSFSYLQSDHQGSIASITSSTGAVEVSESYTATGNRRNPSTWSGAAATGDLTAAAGLTRQGYTFQTQLGLWMGLNHMNGRVQDAITGRFLSADPNIPDSDNAQAYNRYSYVYNNPATLLDPSGFAPCSAQELLWTLLHVHDVFNADDSIDRSASTVTPMGVFSVPFFLNCTNTQNSLAGNGSGSGALPPQDSSTQQRVNASKCAAAATAVVSVLSKLGPVTFDSPDEKRLLNQYFNGSTTPFVLSAAEMGEARAYVNTYGSAAYGGVQARRADGLVQRPVFFGRYASSAPSLDALMGTATGIFSSNGLVGLSDTFNFDLDFGKRGLSANFGVALARIGAFTCGHGDVKIPVSGGVQ